MRRRHRPSPFSQNIIRESGFNANSLRPLFRLIFYKNLHSAAIRVPTRNHARTPPPSGKRKRRPFSGRATVTGCKKRCILFHTPLDNRPPGRHTNRNCRKGPPNHAAGTHHHQRDRRARERQHCDGIADSERQTLSPLFHGRNRPPGHRRAPRGGAGADRIRNGGGGERRHHDVLLPRFPEHELHRHAGHGDGRGADRGRPFGAASHPELQASQHRLHRKHDPGAPAAGAPDSGVRHPVCDFGEARQAADSRHRHRQPRRAGAAQLRLRGQHRSRTRRRQLSLEHGAPPVRAAFDGVQRHLPAAADHRLPGHHSGAGRQPGPGLEPPSTVLRTTPSPARSPNWPT